MTGYESSTQKDRLFVAYSKRCQQAETVSLHVRSQATTNYRSLTQLSTVQLSITSMLLTINKPKLYEVIQIGNIL